MRGFAGTFGGKRWTPVLRSLESLVAGSINAVFCDTGSHQTTVVISLEEMSSNEGNTEHRIETLPPDNADLGASERALSSVPHYLYHFERRCTVVLSRASLHKLLQHDFYLLELHPCLGRRQHLAHTSVWMICLLVSEGWRGLCSSSVHFDLPLGKTNMTLLG